MTFTSDFKVMHKCLIKIQDQGIGIRVFDRREIGSINERKGFIPTD
jgi:hypothetical protein